MITKSQQSQNTSVVKHLSIFEFMDSRSWTAESAMQKSPFTIPGIDVLANYHTYISKVNFLQATVLLLHYNHTDLFGSANDNGQQHPEYGWNLRKVHDGRSTELGVKHEWSSPNLLSNKEAQQWLRHGDMAMRSQLRLVVTLHDGLIGFLGKPERIEESNRGVEGGWLFDRRSRGKGSSVEPKRAMRVAVHFIFK
jgi:hypothetical protein